LKSGAGAAADEAKPVFLRHFVTAGVSGMIGFVMLVADGAMTLREQRLTQNERPET